MSLIINKVKRYVSKFEKIHSNFQTDNFSTTDISKQIFDKFGFSESTPHDYEQIKSRVFGYLNNAEEVISKELKFVTREIFNPEINDELKNKILKAIIDKDESRLWKNLLLYYLMNFDAEDKLILKISQNLKKKKELLSKRWLKRLEYINFLDVKNVYKKLSKKIYEQRKIEPVLFKSGLSGALTSSNLLVNTFYEMAKEAKDHPSDEKAFQFAQIVSENNKIKDSMGPQAMIGLLGKFSQNGNQNINPQLKTTIQNLFLESYGDPRISITKWPGLKNKYGGDKKRNQYIDVIKNWIMLQNIEIFFQIMNETAIEHQFKQRETLWKKIFDKGVITDTCLILGWKTAQYATDRKKYDEECQHLRWGKLDDAEENQSVLLMKIRGESNITIAEWSHNGAFRLWVDSEKSPQLHKSFYSGYQLRRNSNERQVHIGSQWVYKIQKMIENYTGLQIR